MVIAVDRTANELPSVRTAQAVTRNFRLINGFAVNHKNTTTTDISETVVGDKSYRIIDFYLLKPNLPFVDLSQHHAPVAEENNGSTKHPVFLV